MLRLADGGELKLFDLGRLSLVSAFRCCFGTTLRDEYFGIAGEAAAEEGPDATGE